ncbi:MAG: helix-turn-helix domain-containing protein, partial [Chlamydiia bacterium]|nr:helix-turn-helix domain-containing protein [Chlamydiia bacterium]
MDLQIKDVAELLNVSEGTVLKWIKNGKIPAYKLDEQYRFSRSEIEEWLVRHQGQHDEEKADNAKGSSAFSLYRAINKGGIHVRVPGETKEDVILHATRSIAKNLPFDSQSIGELLLEREKLTPTALNEGL